MELTVQQPLPEGERHGSDECLKRGAYESLIRSICISLSSDMSKEIGELREIPTLNRANSIRGQAKLLGSTIREISDWQGLQKVGRTNMIAGRRKGSMTVRATTGTRSSSMASGNLRCGVVSC